MIYVLGFVLGCVIGSVIVGGRRTFGIYRLWLAGMVVEVVPRRFLPGKFLWWYNDSLMNWKGL